MLVFLCLCSPPSVTTEDNYHQTIYSLTRWERYFRRRRRRNERNILFSRHCLIEVGVHHCSTWLYSSAKNRAINTLTSLSLSLALIRPQCTSTWHCCAFVLIQRKVLTIRTDLLQLAVHWLMQKFSMCDRLYSFHYVLCLQQPSRRWPDTAWYISLIAGGGGLNNWNQIE